MTEWIVEFFGLKPYLCLKRVSLVVRNFKILLQTIVSINLQKEDNRLISLYKIDFAYYDGASICQIYF